MIYQIEIQLKEPKLFIENPKEIFEQHKKKLEENFVCYDRAYRKTAHSGITYQLIFKMIPRRIIREKEAEEIFQKIFDEKKFVVDLFLIKKICGGDRNLDS